MSAASGKDDWQSSNKYCYVTPCDGKCDPGDIKITDQKCGTGDKRSRLCYPLSGAPDPKDYTWRGNPWYCNDYCHDDEVMMEMNKWGGDDSVGGSCFGDGLPLTFSSSVLTILEDVAKIMLRVVGRSVPLAALTGEALLFVLAELDLDTDKYYCCPKGDIDKWSNCAWDAISAAARHAAYSFGECAPFAVNPRIVCSSYSYHLRNGTNETSDSQQNLNDAAFQFVVLASLGTLQVSPDKRDGLYWGIFNMVKPEIKREFTYKYQNTLTAKLIDETWSCTKGDVSYEGHLLA
ncbi:hypothetical protein GL218_05040 [Daldinia childiae]|uniref:uncharacterized protein n=1 Tax=Daldinia childiae TaxID=326645 RepID=UPI001445C219|nr:uncharacterized protein GL218_05040 [Daldinia childiae]KAF3060032.1 hypothetical protein GL218_05040 [Daldinia childiae]